MPLHPDFKLPGRGKLTSRKSTLTGMFYVSIAPVFKPTHAEVDRALRILGMKRGECSCAYCGKPHTEWDHLRPLVKDREPTGYVTEIGNLVPSCAKCNQSKRNEDWKKWMRSDAKNSPKTLQVPDLAKRIRRLDGYVAFWKPRKLNFAKIVGTDNWAKHKSHLDRLLKQLAEAERHAVICRRALESDG